MMIRCSEKHREECLNYLRQDPSLNLFFIGDIENYGFNEGFQTVFIDKDEFVHGIYLVFHHCLLVTSKEGRLDLDFIERLIAEYQIQFIQGRSELIDLIPDTGFHAEYCTFSEMKQLRAADMKYWPVRRAELDDADGLLILLDAVFGRMTEKAMIVNRIQSGEGRHYLIEKDGQVLAQANSSAETREAAMIGGVATLPEFRRQGMASAVLEKLCRDLLAEGKRPCLFYSSAEAGRIYCRLGFEPIGQWKMLERHNESEPKDRK